MSAKDIVRNTTEYVRRKQLSEPRKAVGAETDNTVVSIASGKTRYYERMRADWIQLIEASGEVFSREDFSQIKFTKRESVKQPDEKRIFEGMIKYLKSKEYITPRESRQLSDSVRTKEDKNELFQEVVKKVRKEFSDNKIPEEFQGEEYIRGLFFKLNERKLLESMSFGFNMSVDEVNIFLTKVFHSTELDMDIPDEFLLSIVLQSQPQEKVSRYQQYITLKKYFVNMDDRDITGTDSDEDIDIQGQRLFDGEHCTIETINPALDRLLKKYTKKHMTINQLVKTFHEIPSYRYVIYYLYCELDSGDLETDPEVLFQEIEKKKAEDREGEKDEEQIVFDMLVQKVLFQDAEREKAGEAETEGEKNEAQAVFCELVKRVQEQFKKRGLPDEFCTEYYIREMILKLDETMLLESMVFGLDMTVEAVNTFLTKVLKRSALDYYNSDEYLLAIVLYNRRDDKPTYPLYLELKNYYKTIKVEPEDEEIVPKYTKAIISDADMYSIENKDLFRGSKCTDESINPKLKEMMKKHHLIRKKLHQTKDGKPFEVRTVDEVFFEMLKKTQAKYREEISRCKEAQKEAKPINDSRLLLQRRAASGILQIRYKPDLEIELKKSCRFYRLADKNSPDNENNRVWFVLDEDVKLPACQSIKYILPVQSITERGKNKRKLVEVGTRLQVKNDNKGILAAKADSGLRYIKSKNDKGRIEVECMPGTVIEKGTRFIYVENGVTYEFESTKKLTADMYISSDITVFCRYFKENGEMIEDRERLEDYFKQIGIEKEQGKYYIIAKTGTICQMESLVEGIESVNNPKPIKFESIEPTNDSEPVSQQFESSNLEKDKFSPFYRYLYEEYFAEYSESTFDEEYLAEYSEKMFGEIDTSLFGKWFTATEIKYTTVNEQKFSKMKTKEKRNYILTLIFLIEAKNMIGDGGYALRSSVFEEHVNVVMQECRLQKLYMGNPYDCLLTYLIMYDSPTDALREIWAAVKMAQEQIKVRQRTEDMEEQNKDETDTNK